MQKRIQDDVLNCLWHSHAAMGFYIGIDGGGTKTTCIVGDENRVLGTGTAGGSNIVRQGEQQTQASLRTAISTACASAKLDPNAVSCACIGIAGVSIPGVTETVRRIVAEVVSGKVVVLADRDTALEAAFEGGPGVIVESGSGSFAYGKNERGETARAGGYGFQIGDEGSGYWIGRAAIAAALRVHDTGAEPSLLQQLSVGLGVSSRDELLRIANGVPIPDFACLFPVVAQTADEGDSIAHNVLKRAGEELAQLALVVINRIWRSQDGVQVAMVGGVFQNSSIIRHEFSAALKIMSSNVRIGLSVANPVMGALSLARKHVVIEHPVRD